MSELLPCPFCGGAARPTAHLTYSWQDIGRGHALYLPEDLARQLMRALAQVLGDPDPAPPSELELVTAERDRLRSGLWSVAHTARSYLPKCDGNHGGPRCYDPECWSQED